MTATSPPLISASHYRQVLGQFPTGVVVVSAHGDGGAPTALTIGSFSSVSINPPLVAFYPDKNSSSWPKIAARGHFCINVLSASQEDLCRAFARKGEEKFAGVSWSPAVSGSPIIDGVVAWIDCDLDRVVDLGDHWLVVGRVRDLQVATGDLPLLFFRGGYGRFTPSSLAASDAALAGFLPVVDQVRPELEGVATECGAECLLVAQVRDEFVVLAGAGTPHARTKTQPTRVGRRLPYLAPLGVLIAAWGPDEDLTRWVGPDASPDDVERWRHTLARVRQSGFVVGTGHLPYAVLEEAIEGRDEGHLVDPALENALGEVRRTMLTQPDLVADEDYEVRSLSVPVFMPGGGALQMGLYGLDSTMDGAQVERHVARLQQAAAAATAAIGGSTPIR